VKVSTTNEYGRLRSVLLGSATGGAWPHDDKFFNEMINNSTWPTKLERTAFNVEVVSETEHELSSLQEILERNNVVVHRPRINGPHWAYSARDILLTVGNKLIECPTPYASRRNEAKLYEHLKEELECEWIKAPTPDFHNAPTFDAANVLKLDDKLLYLVSKTANREGAEWLQHAVGSEFEVVTWEGVYSHAHIDSTVSSLCKDTVLLNGSRVTEDNLPSFMQDYKKIWVNDIEEKDFYEFPFASKWIGMNILSIDPETVIVDPLYKDLILTLQEENFKVIQTPLTHARTLGGGFHCVTCDLERE
jgi:N-dimethylarginine dimethylaminohydrolase